MNIAMLNCYLKFFHSLVQKMTSKVWASNAEIHKILIHFIPNIKRMYL